MSPNIAIHFSHANGFPARCYTPLFERLGVDVSFVDMIGHGDFRVEGDFEQVVEELIRDVERRHTRPVTAMGHSTGGVLILLAAARRPELFRDFILLDPVLFCGFKRWAIGLTRVLGFREHVGPARLSKKRRTRFSSLDEVRNRYAEKAVFRRFHPECFDSYLQYGFKPTAEGDGVELAFSSAIETEIFASTQTRVPKALYGLRGLLIYGLSSTLFWPVDARWWRRRFAHFDVEGFPGGHLFPFEDPDGVAERIRRYLEQAD